jgi:hypothetical protein
MHGERIKIVNARLFTLEVLFSKQAECCWLFSVVTRFTVAPHDYMNELRQTGNEKPRHVLRLNFFLSLNYLKTLFKCIGHVGLLDFCVPFSERELITAEDVDNHYKAEYGGFRSAVINRDLTNMSQEIY